MDERTNERRRRRRRRRRKKSEEFMSFRHDCRLRRRAVVINTSGSDALESSRALRVAFDEAPVGKVSKRRR